MRTLKFETLYVMEKIIIEEVMNKLDIFQSRFGKIDEFGWWDLDRISADAAKKFILTGFKGECQNHGVHLTLTAPEYQEMNGRVKVTRRTLRKNSQYLIVQAIFLEAYINFALMYTT